MQQRIEQRQKSITIKLPLSLFISLLFLFVVNAQNTHEKDNYTGSLTDSILHTLLGTHAEAGKQSDLTQFEKTTDILIRYYQLNGNYNQAFFVANDYLQTVLKTGDTAFIPQAYYYVGKLYDGLGLSDISLEYLLKMTTYPLIPKDRCRVFYAIAEALRHQHDLHESGAFTYYKYSEEIAQQLGDSICIAQALMGQSQMYFNSQKVHHFQTGIRTGMQDSLNRSTGLLLEALNFAPDIHLIHTMLGLNYAGLQDFENALRYGENGLKLTENIPDAMPQALNGMASIRMLMGDYDQAVGLTQKAYEYSQKVGKKSDMADATSIMYAIYKTKKDYGKALEAYEISVNLNNAVRNRGKELKTLALRTQFDIAPMEEQLENAKVRIDTYHKLVTLIAAGLAIVLVLLGVYIYLYLQKKDDYLALIKEKQQRKEVSTDAAVTETTNQQIQRKNAILIQQLRKLVEKEKLFKDPELSLALLANKINTNRSYISQAINQADMNFNSFINEYRIKEAVKLMSDPGLSLESIALEAGFNNKISFYRIFKKATGLSPSEYRKNIKK